MIRAILVAVTAACSVAPLVAAASGDDKPKDAPQERTRLCDVYGPGYEPLAGSGVCVKIGGSIEVGVSSGGRHGSVATSTDWITTKAAPAGN